MNFHLALTIPQIPNRLWNLITENPLVSAVIAGLVVAVATWIVKVVKTSSESRRIYAFLERSTAESPYTFRTTHAISAATKIPEPRVAELCSRHPRIKRNEQERQTWQVVS